MDVRDDIDRNTDRWQSWRGDCWIAELKYWYMTAMNQRGFDYSVRRGICLADESAGAY